MATYAMGGRLDAEGEMLLGICEAEFVTTIAGNTGLAASYFGERLAIVRAIQAALR